MKIAFLSFYSGDIYRGVETYVHELSNKLVGLGNEVVVYQRGKELPNALYKTIIVPVKVDYSSSSSYFPYLNYFGLIIGGFTLRVLRQIEKDVDIVIPTNGQWQSLFCSVWTKWHRKKMIISGQSGPGLDDRLNIFTFPDVFVGLTKYQMSWAKKTNPFIRSVCIPNGVNLDDFTPTGRKIKLNLPGPVVLCVAAFDYWKRLDLAIKAVAKLKKVSLLLVGRGKEEDRLRKMGKKYLPGRFEIMFLPHNEIPSVYRSCKLMTFPTVPWESFGIVLLEAMASGLGVVATNDPIRREIVGNAGILIDPRKTEEYAYAIKEALKINWEEKSKEQVVRFSWDKIAISYNNIFISLRK